MCEALVDLGLFYNLSNLDMVTYKKKIKVWSGIVCVCMFALDMIGYKSCGNCDGTDSNPPGTSHQQYHHSHSNTLINGILSQQSRF